MQGFAKKSYGFLFRTGPNLLDLVDVNKYTLGEIKNLLGEKVGNEMKLVYDKLLELRSSVSAQNLDGLSLSRLQSLLSASFSTASGAKSNMIARILSRTENGKGCNSDVHKHFLY